MQEGAGIRVRGLESFGVLTQGPQRVGDDRMDPTVHVRPKGRKAEALLRPVDQVVQRQRPDLNQHKAGAGGGSHKRAPP